MGPLENEISVLGQLSPGQKSATWNAPFPQIFNLYVIMDGIFNLYVIMDGRRWTQSEFSLFWIQQRILATQTWKVVELPV